MCCFCNFGGRGNREGGGPGFDFEFAWDLEVDEVFDAGGFGFCRSMTSGSPAFRIFVPEQIAHPSTPSDPRYRLDQGPGGEELGDFFLTGSLYTTFRVMKLFKVGSNGFFP